MLDRQVLDHLGRLLNALYGTLYDGEPGAGADGAERIERLIAQLVTEDVAKE
ncbi:MAG: hypothetical protein JO048_06280 [Methylobacteriaceae bacterium]|nr:hypothetical protein [Methylobacteriaceae bacterium]